MKTLTLSEIVKMYNEDVANAALATVAEPTGRVIYPAFEPDHAGKNEWAGKPVEIGNDTVTAYYYLTDEDEANLECFGWKENVEFQYQ